MNKKLKNIDLYLVNNSCQFISTPPMSDINSQPCIFFCDSHFFFDEASGKLLSQAWQYLFFPYSSESKMVYKGLPRLLEESSGLHTRAYKHVHSYFFLSNNTIYWGSYRLWRGQKVILTLGASVDIISLRKYFELFVNVKVFMFSKQVRLSLFEIFLCRMFQLYRGRDCFFTTFFFWHDKKKYVKLNGSWLLYIGPLSLFNRPKKW